MTNRIYISKFVAWIDGIPEFSIFTMLASDELSAEKESIELMKKAYETEKVIPHLISTRVVPDQYIIEAYHSLQQLSNLIK